MLNRMGACSLLEAFFKKGTGALRAAHRSQALGDTEVPLQDVRDIETEGARLQGELRMLPEGGSINVQKAKEACEKVAVFEIPLSVLPVSTSDATNRTS